VKDRRASGLGGNRENPRGLEARSAGAQLNLEPLANPSVDHGTTSHPCGDEPGRYGIWKEFAALHVDTGASMTTKRYEESCVRTRTIVNGAS
jgi:hypothetical protein